MSFIRLNNYIFSCENLKFVVNCWIKSEKNSYQIQYILWSRGRSTNCQNTLQSDPYLGNQHFSKNIAIIICSILDAHICIPLLLIISKKLDENYCSSSLVEFSICQKDIFLSFASSTR